MHILNKRSKKSSLIMNSSYLSAHTAELQTDSRRGDKEDNPLLEYEIRELREAYRDDEQRAMGYLK